MNSISKLNIKQIASKKEPIDWSVKMFDFGPLKFDYKNMKQNVDTTQYTSALHVLNYLARKQDNCIIKRTEIHLYDKIVVLQDTLQYKKNQQLQKEKQDQIQNRQSQPIIEKNNELIQQIKSSNQNQQSFENIKNRKITLMPKKNRIQKMNINGNQFQWKRETKNIPRNILRAFIKKVQQEDIELGQILKKFLKKLKYNNSFIQEIINHPTLRFKFKRFLSKEIVSWLNTSKIRDKQSHFEAIKIYLNRINMIEKGEINQQKE